VYGFEGGNGILIIFFIDTFEVKEVSSSLKPLIGTTGGTGVRLPQPL
jgi:hypothetical protein